MPDIIFLLNFIKQYVQKYIIISNTNEEEFVI